MRIVRQLLVESVLLACISGAVGLVLAVLLIRYILPGRKYVDRDVRVDFVKRMQEHLHANGAIVAASAGSGLPVFGGVRRQLEIDGNAAPDAAPQTIGMVSVGPTFFEALDIRMLRGCSFDPNDGTPARETAIVGLSHEEVFSEGRDGQVDPDSGGSGVFLHPTVLVGVNDRLMLFGQTSVPIKQAVVIRRVRSDSRWARELSPASDVVSEHAECSLMREDTTIGSGRVVTEIHVGVADHHGSMVCGQNNVVDAQKRRRDPIRPLRQVLESDVGQPRRAISIEMDRTAAVVA